MPFFSILVGVVGCSISVAVFQFTQSAEEHRIADTFHRRAENQMSVFDRTIDLYTEILFSLHTLFISSEDVTRAEFREATTKTLTRHSGVRALEWVPAVTAGDRQRVESEMRATGNPAAQFTEKNESGQLVRAGSRPLHLPILYVEPVAGNEAAFGYDLITGPNTRMLATARDEGIVGTSEKIRLIQEPKGRYGLIMAIPVYRTPSPPDTVEGRRAALRGYVQGVFIVDQLIGETIERTPVRGLDILVIDKNAAPTNNLLGFVSTMENPGKVPTVQEMMSGQHREMTARIGNREWTFLFRPNQMWLSNERTAYPGILLIGGLLFSMLLSGYLTTRFRREQHVKYLVNERTGELTRTNARLEREIQERQKTEAALRQTEANLTESQRIAKLGSWEVDLLVDSLWWSDECYRLFGCQKGKFHVNTENFYALVHPDDREKVRGAMIKALSAGEMYHIEHRAILADGTERFMVEQAEVIRDSKGVPVKLTGTVMDITERKMADEAIRQSERIYRTLVETTNTGYLIVDQQGNVLNANAEYVLLTGHRSLDDIRGRNVLEWTAPYDIERNRREIEKTPRTGKVRNLEIDYRHPNGFIQPIEINATLIDSEQGPCMIVLVRDISERRRAQHEQERLVSILEATTDLVSTASPDLQLLYLNRGGRQMMGYGDQQAAPHRHVSDMLPEKSLAMIRDEAIPEANSLGIWTGEAMLLHRDGHMIPVSALLIAHRSDEGLLEYYSMVFRDLSEQRKIELHRQEIERKLQETQKLESLGVLAGGIAHDFNNLLTGILGNASLARLQLDTESGIDPYLDQIEKASLRAADLCKQMLAYSGKGRFIVQRIQLTDLVEDTTPLLHLSISKKAILKFHLTRELPPIMADATQIRQILMNLVINASEAIGDRSGIISISTGVIRADSNYLSDTYLSPNLPEGDYVFLEVSDNGCGMSPDTRARIFDPFFTTKFTGRGLGLAAVLGIVRGHQGALKVFSEPGQGTTFKMLLPCADGPVEKFQSHDSTHAPLWSGKGMILVVDDEETVRTVTARMLESLGFQTTLAEDGREAVKIFLERPGTFTYVMLDLTMPHMDGEETFRELRRIQHNIRVLLMSGFNEQDATSRFVGKGLAGFLQKPFKADQLAAKLQEIENDLR